MQSSCPSCTSYRSVASRALIRVPTRWHLRSFYVRLRPDPLLSFQIPQVFNRAPWGRLRASSAHDLFRELLTVTPALVFSVSISARLFRLSPVVLPVRSSRASVPAAEATVPASPDYIVKQSAMTAELGCGTLHRVCHVFRRRNVLRSNVRIFKAVSRIQSPLCIT